MVSVNKTCMLCWLSPIYFILWRARDSSRDWSWPAWWHRCWLDSTKLVLDWYGYRPNWSGSFKWNITKSSFVWQTGPTKSHMHHSHRWVSIFLVYFKFTSISDVWNTVHKGLSSGQMKQPYNHTLHKPAGIAQYSAVNAGNKLKILVDSKWRKWRGDLLLWSTVSD